MTWVLQPCDTHLSAACKRYLRKLWLESIADREDTDLSLNGLFDIIFRTIEDVINGKNWAYAFKEDGYRNNFGQLSSYIVKQLEYTERPPINIEVPSYETVALCYPANMTVPYNIVLKPLLAAQRALAAPPPAPPPLALPPAPPHSLKKISLPHLRRQGCQDPGDANSFNPRAQRLHHVRRRPRRTPRYLRS